MRIERCNDEKEFINTIDKLLAAEWKGRTLSQNDFPISVENIQSFLKNNQVFIQPNDTNIKAKLHHLQARLIKEFGTAEHIDVINSKMIPIGKELGIKTAKAALEYLKLHGKNLEHLDLTEFKGITANDIHEIVNSCPNLVSLTLRQATITPKAIQDISTLKNLNSLSFEMCDITSLPAEVGLLKSLETLEFVKCSGLTTLPAEIGQLENLRSLRILECSKFRELPKEIGHLKLTEIDLSGCKNFNSLPKEVRQIKELLELNLDQCDVYLKGVEHESFIEQLKHQLPRLEVVY